MLTHCWWGSQTVQPLWKTVWQFLKQLNIELPPDPAIPLLGMYPRGMKTQVQQKLARMFIAGLFTQQPKGGNHPHVHQLMSE